MFISILPGRNYLLRTAYIHTEKVSPLKFLFWPPPAGGLIIADMGEPETLRSIGSEMVRIANDHNDPQVALASRLRVSEAQVSRWLSGEDLPRPWRLVDFGLEYGLDPQEVEELFARGPYQTKETVPCLSMYRDLFRAPPHKFVPLVAEARKRILRGEPQTAIKLTTATIHRLRRIDTGHAAERAFNTDLLLSEAINLRIRAYIESRPRDELETFTLKDIECLKELGQRVSGSSESRGHSILTTALMRQVECNYLIYARPDTLVADRKIIAGVIDDSQSFLDASKVLADSLRVQRIQAVAFAQRGESRNFLEEYKRLIKRTESKRAPILAAGGILHSIEGKARGWLWLYEPMRALEAVEQAIPLIPKLSKLPTFYKAAVTSAHYTRALAVLTFLEPVGRTWGMEYVERAVTSGVDTCAFHNHERKLSDIAAASDRTLGPGHQLTRYARGRLKLVSKPRPLS